MTSRTRTLVLAISVPVIAFVVIGGYLGQALAKDDTYQHLRVFEDVVSLVLNNYVEEVDVSDAMKVDKDGRKLGLPSVHLIEQIGVSAMRKSARAPGGGILKKVVG